MEIMDTFYALLLRKTKVLFIVKRGALDYADTDYCSNLPKSSGLYNSALLVVDMLNKAGVKANLEIATDNNDIDRLVKKHNPKIVVIEALWVVPEKFKVLKKLWPKVTWVIRLHSEFPFLSMEGMAMEWIFKYIDEGVKIAVNSEQMLNELTVLTKTDILYMPNYYPVDNSYKVYNPREFDVVNIGCFGAIRPYKNQLTQAVAAIKFAGEYNLKLHFHINSTRIENQGSPILKNIRSLFMAFPEHKLVEYAWMEHSDFIKLVRSMDYGMQVSYTETFNIVSADFVNSNIPMVVSTEIDWMDEEYQVFFPSKINEIFDRLEFARKGKKNHSQDVNKKRLDKFSKKSKQQWLKTILTLD